MSQPKWRVRMNKANVAAQPEETAPALPAYLVVRREDGFGDVFPLLPANRYTLGRAHTNSVVLQDDLSSREHAEITFAGGRWRIRDLGSRNGTHVNGSAVQGEQELNPRDE